MKKQKKKIFCKIVVIFVGVFVTLLLSFSVIFIKTTWNTTLDEAKLETVGASNNITVYDVNLKEIDTDYMFTGKKFIKIQELPEYVKQAFVATEDKRFYKHNGVDYKRILGATIKNIKNGSFSQGASTISQQLIKNTHLTREKTIDRKFKEIKLAYALEKKYSKEEILEMYLNNIYFGNGCYGLEKASNYYFEKDAKNLSLGEAALLVATINAPSIYDPIKYNDKAESRKKLVLSLMRNQGLISNEEYEKSAKTQENVVKNSSKTSNIHLKSILNEACRKIKVSENVLKNMNLKIETYLDEGVQSIVENTLNNGNFTPKNKQGITPKTGVIVIDNKTKGVVAVSSSSGFDVFKDKRQPGSTIKPILVYAPALEYGLIYPESIIVDEEININGYSPSNANKKFIGKVSVREAVEKSLNIPAVKILSKIGVERAKGFASKIGINFSSSDKNLALALGGMTDGLTIKELADAYSTFASSGGFKESSIIKKITDENGIILYEDDSSNSKVMSDSTADLITDLLKGVVVRGTARRLSSLDFDVASKTGTVGLNSSTMNTDAFNVAYTTNHTVVTWIGALNENERMESFVNGSTYPSLITKNVLSEIYAQNKPEKFSFSDDVVYKYIDTKSLSEGNVELANDETFISGKRLALFSKNNLPEYSNNIDIIVSKLEVAMEENQKPTLIFEGEKDHEYWLYRKDVLSGNESLICNFCGEEKTQKYTDNTAKSGQIYEYYLKIKRKQLDSMKVSNSVKLMSY